MRYLRTINAPDGHAVGVVKADAVRTLPDGHTRRYAVLISAPDRPTGRYHCPTRQAQHAHPAPRPLPETGKATP